MAEQIKIFLNDAETTLNSGSSLLELLEQEQLATKTGIAVAINQTVIPKEQWAQKILSTRDQVLVITATQGG